VATASFASSISLIDHEQSDYLQSAAFVLERLRLLHIALLGVWLLPSTKTPRSRQYFLIAI